MPLLDSCVNAVFEPGNIGSSSGETPTTIRPGTIYTPDDYPIDTVDYSLNFSRFYNSGYFGAL
ncbi:MAG: hypothetical protein ABWY64_06415 [Tardiphaga sp.]